MTAQMTDTLIHRGQELSLAATPLKPYLARLRRKNRPVFGFPGTACRRGYVATWEFRGDYLWLVAMDAVLQINGRDVSADLQTAMPWVKEALRADWVSDTLYCPEGRCQFYNHNMFMSVYERDRWFKVDKGRLVGEYVTLNPPVPVTYRIESDGRRTCIERGWPETELPDPLEGEDFSQAHLIWGKPLPPEDEEESGYFVAAALVAEPYHIAPKGMTPLTTAYTPLAD